MTTKDLLDACRYAPFEIAAIDHQISRFCFIGAPGGSPPRTPSSTLPGIKYPDAAQSMKIEGYMRVLERKRQENTNLLTQFDQLLKSLPDETDRRILQYYYGNKWTDERIAEELDITDRTVRARRKKVLQLS